MPFRERGRGRWSHGPGGCHCLAYLAEQLRQGLGALSPLERKIFADLNLDTIQYEVLLGMAAGYRAAGREDLAREMLRRHRQRRPWDTSGLEIAPVSPRQ